MIANVALIRTKAGNPFLRGDTDRRCYRDLSQSAKELCRLIRLKVRYVVFFNPDEGKEFFQALGRNISEKRFFTTTKIESGGFPSVRRRPYQSVKPFFFSMINNDAIPGAVYYFSDVLVPGCRMFRT